MLIITEEFDPHADLVVERLDQRGVGVLRLNSSALLSDYQYEFALPGHIATIGDRFGRQVDLGPGTVVYVRKPVPVASHPDLVETAHRILSAAEGETLLGALYSIAEVAWVPHPAALAAAAQKLTQLRVARSIGLTVPPTLVTNNVQSAREFIAAAGPVGVAVKSLSVARVGDEQEDHDFYTGVPPALALLDRAEALALAPTILQHYVPKSAEVRVTIVGDQVFAVELDTQSVIGTAEDWRGVPAEAVPHRLVDLPQALTDNLHRFLDRFRLSIGAIDLIRTPGGDYVFLENNPAGAWYWLELRTGAPITAAVVDLLLGDSAVWPGS